MIQENVKIIQEFFRLVHGSKKWIFFLFLGSILGHISELLLPFFVSNIILFVTSYDATRMYLNIFFLFLTYIFYNLFWYLNYVSYTNNFRYSYQNLREKIIDKVFTYDISFNEKISQGEILNTVHSDVSDLSEMIDNVCEIIVVAVKLIVMLFLFLKTNFFIGIFVVLIVYFYLKWFDYFNVCSTKYLLGQQRYRDKLTNQLSDILNGLKEIKIFHLYDKMKRNFFVLANKWSEQYQKKMMYADIRDSLLPFVIHIGTILLYLILGSLVLNKMLNVNVLILLISYYDILMEDAKDLMGYSKDIREWSVSIHRIHRLLNYSSKEDAMFGENETDLICGSLQFSHVSFTYPSKNKGSIKDISFLAKPNEITALVGRSGSGKTTIMQLLLRNYKVQAGNILVDQESIYHYSKKVYSKNVVGVNQYPFLFSMSIRKNLDLIDTNVEHQIASCKRVGIHDYIMSLPKGYHTIIDENATNFSGGQRQLLAIARTLLSKAEILIFDEVTSSLDLILVEQMKEIFADLKQDHTIVLITHRKDIMSFADHIVVFHDGCIVGDGTHKELMKDNTYYIDLQTHPSNSKI